MTTMRAIVDYGPKRQTAIDLGPSSDFWFTEVLTVPSSGVTVSEATALNYSAVWAATRLLSSTIGMLPLDLYRRLPSGGREVVWDDPRETLVHDRPNREMEAMMFRCQAAQQQINAGNCYAFIERDNRDNILALNPIHHTRVRPVRDDETEELLYEIKNDRREPTYLKAAEVLHVPSMISDDGLVGKGVIRAARETIGFGLATERYGAKWFGAGGVPRIVVTTEKTMNSEARDNFRKEWKEIYGGPEGDKVALLTQGAKAMPLNINNEDAQFLGTREHNVNEIARWYGVPPHMLGDLRRATYSNIEEQSIEFVTHTILPWLKLWEQELWAKLLSPTEQEAMFFEFNVNGLLRGDAKSRAEYLQKMIFSGLMSPNEGRAVENLNPYEGGDVKVMQSAMVPVDMVGAVAEAAAAPKPEPKPDTVAMRAMLDQSRDAESRIVGSVTHLVNNLREEFSERMEKPKSNDAACLAACKVMLSGAVRRMVRIEACETRAAVKNGVNFVKWLDTFYDDKHRKTYTEAISPPCDALIALGYAADAGTLAAIQVERAKSELLELSGNCTATELAQKVDFVVTQWEQGRAAEVADAVLKGTQSCTT